MHCFICGEKDLVSVSAKCSDMCCVSYKNQESLGYVPENIGIGGGDYINFEYCPKCGSISGEFPITIKLKKDEEEVE